MNNYYKWAVAGNVLTCIYVGGVFYFTESGWAFLLLLTLTVIKNKKQ
jgi:hypothetical protein